LKAIRLLNLKRILELPLRAALAVAAIAAGSSLLVGVLIDQASLDRSMDAFVAQRAGNAELEVHGPGGPAGLDESVLPAVRAVEGVATAAPIVQAVVIAETAAGDERFIAAFGVDCSIEGVLGEFGCDDEMLTGLPGAFATSRALAEWLGADGVVRTDAGRLHIMNAFPVDVLDGINRGNVVGFSLTDAQRLLGHDGALTSILIVPEPGTDVAALRAALQEAVGPHNQVSEPGTVGGIDFAAALVTLLLFISVFGLAIGAQLVHNTMALSLEERRRDLAVVGAIGAPPRTLLTGTLIEAAALGLLGGVLGAGGGILVARPLVGALSDTLDRITGIQLDVHVTPLPLLAGVLLGVATSVLAAVGPARRAAAMDVAAELHGQARREETTTARRGRRAVAYGAVALAGVVLAWIGHRDGAIEPWQPVVAYVGFALTAFSAFRAVQHGAAPFLAVVQRAPFLRNGAARVAISSLVGEPKRTGTMVTALAAAVGIGVLLGNVNASIVRGADDASARFSDDGVIVTSLPVNNTLSVASRLAPGVIDAVQSLPVVDQVAPNLGFCGAHPAIGDFCVETQDPARTEWPVHRGRPSVTEVFANDEVLIGTGLARTRGLRPGDTFELPGRTGIRTVTVGAIWGDPDNTGMSISIPHSTFVDLYGDRPASGVRVTPVAGVTAEELDAAIEAAALDPDLRSLRNDEFNEEIKESISSFVTPFWALQRGMLVVSLIAVTSTLLLTGIQRRREHGLLLAVGMAPGSLSRMVLVEAGVIGIVGTIAGTVAGGVTYVAMILVSPLFTGLSAPFGFDTTAPLVFGGIGLVFVLLGAALPAWRTARLDPGVALRYE